MKKLFFAVAAIAFMASCSNNEVMDDNENGAVKFGAVVGNTTNTRASTYGLIDLAALKASNDGFAVSTNGLGTGAEMNNVTVKYTGGAWSYTNDYFWPLSASQNVSFVAYAPAGSAGVTLTNTGISIGGFVQNTSLTNQTDLLYAAPANFNRLGSSSGVVLTFKHVLTQVVFAVTSDIPSADNPQITSIVLTVPNGNGNYNGTAWTASSNPQNYTVFSSNPLSNTAVISAPLLMVPQTLPVGTNAKVTFSVNGVQNVNTVDLSTLSVVKVWSAGNKVTYNISFKNDDLKIKFADPTISTWTDASDGFIY